MRNYLKYQHPGVQFAVFMGIAAMMFFTYMTIAQIFFGDVGEALSKSNEISAETLKQFRWSQFLSAVMTFIIPASVYAYLSDERPFHYLGLKQHARVLIFLIVIFLLVAVQPFAIYMGQLNQNANFGLFQEGFKRMEEFSENAMKNFVRMNNPYDLMINLFIVAILPAVGEELFFRGALQNILERWTRVPWVAILLSSLLFALAHITAFKFLPILTLGAVLGTLFYITRNLWYNVFFHFLNNFMALLASYYATKYSMLKKLTEDDYRISLLVALASLAVTIGLFLLIRKRTPYHPLTSTSQSPAHFDIN